MKSKSNYTTPEQSKKLLELGLPSNSADCYNVIDSDVYNKDDIRVRQNDYEISYSFFNNKHYNPCWSVGRLIEILKICIANTYKTELDEIFEELEMCIDTVQSLVQIFIEYKDVIDFSKLELEY